MSGVFANMSEGRVKISKNNLRDIKFFINDYSNIFFCEKATASDLILFTIFHLDRSLEDGFHVL